MGNWMHRAKQRMERGEISQRDLARALECTRGAIGHYLAGRRRPSLQQLDVIARALRVEPAWLVYGVGPVHIREEQPGYKATFPAPEKLPVTGDTESGPLDQPLKHLDKDLLGARCFGLTVSAGSAGHRYYQDETIILDPAVTPEPGDDVFARLLGGRTGIYSLLRLEDTRIMLETHAPPNQRQIIPRSEIDLVHVIVAVIRPGIF